MSAPEDNDHDVEKHPAGDLDTGVLEVGQIPDDSTPDTPPAGNTEPKPTWRIRLSRPERPRRPGAIGVAGALAVASVATAGTAYLTIHRADAATDDAATQAVLAAADNGAVSVLSYSPESLDADFARARSSLTGQFLNYYQEFTDKVVKPAATENDVVTKAQVVRSAVAELSKDNAQVLAFINQTTTSKNKPEPELTSSSVRITLQQVDGDWLISSFDPV
ncbi:hypothetical protein GIY30_18335 [Gordonia sp. HNM0687]|uniref:Twin-arginine translocation pathway signal n=1 Tax=Gordonia mangrovi TaxID=2665643 RepID=A0A6L7GXJ1_9ACTN|nr:hypothetical protein [Gordonia mangrovi]MXP23298.1 hypothetical protein [Gordonia mangrovi]UVF76786.1 hypothetical protein NWF22_15685 [Gordonia mangrovi]